MDRTLTNSDRQRRRSLFTAVAVGSLFLLSAAAVWWFMPLRPRAILLEGSEILGLSPDGRFLATRKSGRVTLWDVTTGQAAGELPDDQSALVIWDVAFSPDGRWLAAGGGEFFHLWEVPEGREWAAVPIAKNARASPTFSPDGKWLAFQVERADHSQELTIWDLAQGRERISLPGPRVDEVHWSPDGKTLAFQSAEPKPGIPPTGRIRLWDAETGAEQSLLDNDPGPLRLLAFSPDSRFLATGERPRWQWQGEHEIKLRDLTTGKAEAPWKMRGGALWLRFTADGSSLLVAGGDSQGVGRQLRVIDPGAVPPEGVGEPIPFTVNTSPDGRLLSCVAHAREPIIIRDLPGGRERATLQPRHSGDTLFPRHFSPDGQWLAVDAVATPASPSPAADWLRKITGAKPASPPPPPHNATLYLYETNTGQTQEPIPEVSSPALFTPDGRTLVVVAGPEKRPTLWDLPLCKPWDRILAWWGLLALFFVAVGLWLRRRRASDNRKESLAKDAKETDSFAAFARGFSSPRASVTPCSSLPVRGDKFHELGAGAEVGSEGRLPCDLLQFVGVRLSAFLPQLHRSS
jgi:WD40 repeat protein